MQLIKDKEDREFTTTVGHWSGDIAWEPGPVGGKTGLLQLKVLEPSYQGTIILSYPQIKVIRNKENTLGYEIAVQEGPGTDFFGDGILTDGNYELPIDVPVIATQEVWFSSGAALDIPADWDIENTRLELWVWSESNDEGKIVFDNFSFTAVAPKPQYLPIMGVG